MVFSIIIPNFNNSRWLRKCLDSVLAQKFSSYEVIFVDDCSSDNSVAIAEEYICKFRSMKVIRCREKQYNGGARNKGLIFANGDYVLFIDSDDSFADDMCLADIFRFICHNNRPDLIRLSYYWCKDGEEKLQDLSEQNTIAKIVADDNVACWTKCVKLGKVVPFPTNTLMEDATQHIAQLDNVETVAAMSEGIVKWNRDNENSCSTNIELQGGKWKSSLYRYYADLLDLQVAKPECKAELEKRRARAYDNIINNRFEQG